MRLRFFGNIVSIVLLFALTSCGGSSAPKSVGILLHGESRVPLMTGFLQELKALGFEDGKNMVVTALNTDGDAKQLKPLAQQLIEKKPDLLVAAGGLEAEEIKAQIEQIQNAPPVLALYINAIIERKFVRDRRDPGWNVTGIDNLNGELSGKRVELLNDLLPNAKKVLILFNPKIEPSVIGLQHAKEAAANRGLEIVERAVLNPDEIRQTMEAVQPGDADAVLLVPTAPIDNQVKDVILPNADRLKIPVFTHSRSMLKAGASASYGAPFPEIGRQGARLAEKILSGQAAKDIPFEIPLKYEYSVNVPALKKSGHEVPDVARRQVTEMIE